MPYDLSKISKKSKGFSEVDKRIENYEFDRENSEEYIVGSTGCGLCSLSNSVNSGMFLI